MTETAPAPVPAGWYPDPRGTRQRRWWDGSAWTHALEAPPEPARAAPAAPGYANLPGPSVSRVPSPSAPTVKRALASDPTESHFPTRRQLRDAAAVIEAQKQLTEPDAPSPVYAMGPAVSATQKPQASFSIEQFRTAASLAPSAPIEHVTKSPSEVAKSPAISTVAAASLSETPAEPAAQTFSPVTAATPVSAFTQTHTFLPTTAQVKTPAAETSGISVPSAEPSFVPVMRTGDTRTAPVATSTAPAPATMGEDPQYQPFGMTPHITTGTVETSNRIATVAVWLLAITPAVLVGLLFALTTFAAEFSTVFAEVALVFVVFVASIALAMRDRRQLASRSHRPTASAAWVLLSPLGYLVARAVFTSRQGIRGWAPAVVYVVVVGASAAFVYFSPMLATLINPPGV